MDLKIIHDETDLSVGLSVTCSTTTGTCYIGDEALITQTSYDSTPSLFLMHYTSDKNVLSNADTVVYSPDISFNQSLSMNEHGIGITQRDEFEQDEDVVRLNSYRLNKHNHKYSSNFEKNNSPYSSSRRLHPDAHKMQVCKTCGKTFKFQTSLLRHNNKVHISRYQCTTCFRVFSRQSYLDVHTSKPGTSCYIEHKIKTKKRH